MAARLVNNFCSRKLFDRRYGRLGSAARASTGRDVDFSDTRKAFQGKSTGELLRAYLLFNIFKYEVIVNNSHRLLRVLKALTSTRLYHKVLKATVYRQFVAGECSREVKATAARYRSMGIRPMLAYAAEDEVKQGGTPSSRVEEVEISCDHNLKYILDCIETAASINGIISMKITSLTSPEILLKYSEALTGGSNLFHILSSSHGNRVVTMDTIASGLADMKVEVSQSDIERMFRELDHTHSGTLDMFQWTNNFQPNTQLYKILSRKKWSELQPTLPVMSEIERDQMISMIKRTEVLSQCASDRGVKMLVDAEQTYLQPAIRHIAVNILMPKYNLVSPVVYNTQQCYLKDALHQIVHDMKVAEYHNCHFGVKIVRGAYIEEERALAKKKGYSDPIWDSKEATNASYHKVLDEVLGRVSEGRINAFLGTHNPQSLHYAMNKLRELNIDRQCGDVVFGQVFGMSDHLSIPLGSNGYIIYKCMPYGPVEVLVSYLIRRAYENKGMIEGAVRERSIIAQELKRRMTNKP